MALQPVCYFKVHNIIETICGKPLVYQTRKPKFYTIWRHPNCFSYPRLASSNSANPVSRINHATRIKGGSYLIHIVGTACIYIYINIYEERRAVSPGSSHGQK